MQCVKRLLFTHSEPPAGVWQEVGGVGSALHAAGENRLRVTEANPVSGQHDGAQPRTAADVNGKGGNIYGNPGFIHRVTRRIGSNAGLPTVAQNDLFHRF
ncbi:hypothetical protein SDC9_158515 [bioreactor metagenome]|uniref:Uncharacterized protein n=1 Tax=bioreactor metagenome TaxID=1076179 RepID=A0A645FFD7_9ZZZZ